MSESPSAEQLEDIWFLLCPGRRAENCNQFVCLSVYLSVREHISGTVGPIFTKFLVQIPMAVAPSSFGGIGIYIVYFQFYIDDITFGRSGLYGDAWKAEPLTYYHSRRCNTWVESDVYECLVISGLISFVNSLHLEFTVHGDLS